MYPTFPKGSGKTDDERSKEIVAEPYMRKYPSGFNLFGYDFFKYQLKRGDIVEFDNAQTKRLSLAKYGEEAGFVKRVVAVGRDSIKLRDGYVILNGQTITENYTAKPRSTYGGSFLPDCNELIIPEEKVFVMGDNRKASLDSRFEIELINMGDIRHILPLAEQKGYEPLWRDTNNDSSYANTTTLDGEDFVKLINEKRKIKNLKTYKYNILLSNSAKIRGSAMLKFNDFSENASKSGMTLQKSIKESGYYNILYAEVFTRGFFEAPELMENMMEFPELKKYLFTTEYQDIGVSAVLGEVADCPTQVVAIHLGGYVPPNYNQKDIDSWKELIDNLSQVLPSWEKTRGVEGIDQGKLERLITVYRTRMENAQKIYNRMKANQWLTEQEEKLIGEDQKLAEEGDKVLTELKK